MEDNESSQEETDQIEQIGQVEHLFRTDFTCEQCGISSSFRFVEASFEIEVSVGEVGSGVDAESAQNGHHEVNEESDHWHQVVVREGGRGGRRERVVEIV